MSKLTPLPTQRVIKALQRAGWEQRKNKPGRKHYILVHPSLPGILTIPRHPKIAKGTLSAIIKQAGMTQDDFFRYYR